MCRRKRTYNAQDISTVATGHGGYSPHPTQSNPNASTDSSSFIPPPVGKGGSEKPSSLSVSGNRPLRDSSGSRELQVGEASNQRSDSIQKLEHQFSAIIAYKELEYAHAESSPTKGVSRKRHAGQCVYPERSRGARLTFSRTTTASNHDEHSNHLAS